MDLERKLGKARLVALILYFSTAVADGQAIPLLPPLTPAELSMSDNPKQPGAAAAILYYAVDTDNQKWTETHALRIKVFRDEGKSYADVKIPYFERFSLVEEIQGRTISSDGKITPFSQEIFDREILKFKKFGYHAKIFTLPNVQSGSVLECSYRVHYKEKIPEVFRHPEKYIFDRGFTFPAANWEIQHGLYLVHGQFSLLPVKGANIDNFAQGMQTVTFSHGLDGRMTLDIRDVEAFEPEEYALPEEALKKKINL